MASNALTLPGRTSHLPDANTFNTMMQMSEVLLDSGLLPPHIKTPQAAFAIIQKGIELDVPPMYACSNIVLIQGKPTANAELMLALIYRDHGDNAAQFVATTPEGCTISYARRGWTNRREHSFTIEEAQKASLIKAGPWSQYPAAMLRARCISAVARLAFPDSIAGMYLAEEMGATVNAEGEIESVPEPEHATITSTAAPARVEAPRSAPLPQRVVRFTDAASDAASTRIREVAPAKGLVLPTQHGASWGTVINFVRDGDGVVDVADDGTFDPRAVGEALLALPDVDEGDEGDDETAPVDVAIASDTAGDDAWSPEVVAAIEAQEAREYAAK